MQDTRLPDGLVDRAARVVAREGALPLDSAVVLMGCGVFMSGVEEEIEELAAAMEEDEEC